jgi:hypothetical protein
VEFTLKRVTPKLFFDKLIESIEKGELKLPSFDQTWTKIMIDYFKRMGRNFGYDVWPEYMRLDCPWMKHLPPKISTIEVSIEYEDSEYLDAVLEETLKLGHLKANMKIIVYYPKMDNIDEHLQRISEYIDCSDIKTPEEKWLIITISKVKSEIIFQGHERTPDGKWKSIGKRSFDEKHVSR